MCWILSKATQTEPGGESDDVDMDKLDVELEVRDIDASQDELDALEQYLQDLKRRGETMPMTIEEWIEMYRKSTTPADDYDRAMKGMT